jgi:hypothetical protein
MKMFTIFWVGCVATLTGSAALDVLGHFGWGFHPKDVWGGLLMLAFSVPMWGVFWLIQQIVSAGTRFWYGPEPTEASPP